MRSIFDLTSAADLDAYLARCVAYRPRLDVVGTRASALASIRFHAATETEDAGEALRARWYASLEDGKPDYSVYDADFFIGDVWACWVAYSRKYLLALRSPRALASVW